LEKDGSSGFLELTAILSKILQRISK